MPNIEIAEIDIRFEHCHLHNPKEEKCLLVSLMEGIQRPLLCIKEKQTTVLIDGFKRYRCANKLNISIVPVEYIAKTAAEGLLELMFRTKEYKLTILEEARMISELKELEGFTAIEIAKRVFRSKSWVSMRMNLLSEMNDDLLKKLFNGSFPAYTWMSSVRPRMLKNKSKISDGLDFIDKVAGKGHSHREIDHLAYAYFEGNDSMRKQIQEGKSDWLLNKLANTDLTNDDACLPFERKLLKSLASCSSIMTNIAQKSRNKNLQKKAFFAQAHIVTGCILGMLDKFKEELEVLHDRCQQA